MVTHEDPKPRHDAPQLLLIPGNMCTDLLWRPVEERLIAAGYAVRQAPPLDASSVALMAQAVLNTLDTPTIVVGFSMGAIVAAELSRQAPHLVQGLGLIAFNAYADLPDRAAVRPRQQAAAREGRLRDIVADELKPNYLAGANRRDAGLLETVMKMALSLGAETFVTQSEALRLRPDLRPALASLTMPVLLVCGAEDRLCPPEWHCGWARSVGDNATFVEISGAGHLLPLESPLALADVLLNWLAEKFQ